MRIRASAVPEGHSVVTGTVTVDSGTSDDIRCIEPVACRAEIDRIQSRIQIRLFYRGKAELVCARCLECFSLPVNGETAVIATFTLEQGIHLIDDEEYGDECIDRENHEIDLSAMVRDELLTALPMKPLCSEQCAGIRHPEPASVAEIDPRWEALKKLKS
jgi:uncharacterized protein